jgi:hypothetical protein
MDSQMNTLRNKFIGLTRNILSIAALALIVAFFVSGCKHEPLLPNVITDGTGNGIDTGDGTGNGLPCNPDSIYFQQQILPFLVSGCAKIGCHDAATAEDGVILDSYTNVMATGGVTPFDLSNSDLWEVITETDPGDMMPPQGETPLTQAQIDLIGQWISQGALNLICDDGLGPCDSTTVSYVADVLPIIQNKCVGCHGTANSGNAFINLSNHAGVADAASTGQLVGSIAHSANLQPCHQVVSC